jgi:hypothetical protein
MASRHHYGIIANTFGEGRVEKREERVLSRCFLTDIDAPAWAGGAHPASNGCAVDQAKVSTIPRSPNKVVRVARGAAVSVLATPSTLP